MTTRNGAETAEALKAFIESLAGNPLLRVLQLKVGRAAARAQVERARQAGGTADELLELYSVMNGVVFSWAYRGSKKPAGELRIPTLGRNVKGWDGYFSWEEDEEGSMGSSVRLIDLAPIYQGCRLQPLYSYERELAVWNTYGDTFGLQGHSLREYLSAAMESLFVCKWYDSFASDQGLSAAAVEARTRLGIAEKA